MLVSMASSKLENRWVFSAFLAPCSPDFGFGQIFKTVQAAQALLYIVFNLTCSEASALSGIHDNMIVKAR
jgi:hypothetical protein